VGRAASPVEFRPSSLGEGARDERVYPRRATLVAGDFFGALRDRVVVRLRFGCRGGSVDDVSASEAFSAVANAASPLIKSVQASS